MEIPLTKKPKRQNRITPKDEIEIIAPTQKPKPKQQKKIAANDEVAIMETTPMAKHLSFMIMEPIQPQAEVISVVQGTKILKRDPYYILDQKEAKRFLDMPTFDAERRFRREWAKDLMRFMLRGTFLQELATVQTCVVGKQEYRINGMHTCAAVASMKHGFKLKVNYIQWKALDMEIMGALYSSIDRNAPRTVGNQIVAQLATQPPYNNFSHHTIQKLSEGLAIGCWDKTSERRSHDSNDRAALLRGEYRAAAIKIGQLLEGVPLYEVKHMMRAPVIGAMFITYKAKARDADIFWHSVRDGTGIDKPNDPRKRLEKMLMSSGLPSYEKNGKRTMNAEVMLRRCLESFTAFISNRPMSDLRTQIDITQPRPKI